MSRTTKGTGVLGVTEERLVGDAGDQDAECGKWNGEVVGNAGFSSIRRINDALIGESRLLV